MGERVGLAEHILDHFCPPGGTVLDMTCDPAGMHIYVVSDTCTFRMIYMIIMYDIKEYHKTFYGVFTSVLFGLMNYVFNAYMQSNHVLYVPD